MTYFQWKKTHMGEGGDMGSLMSTPECSPEACSCLYIKVYWAWDRRIGAWVHYAA